MVQHCYHVCSWAESLFFNQYQYTEGSGATAQGLDCLLTAPAILNGQQIFLRETQCNTNGSAIMVQGLSYSPQPLCLERACPTPLFPVFLALSKPRMAEPRQVC